jgi:hypothetical protein
MATTMAISQDVLPAQVDRKVTQDPNRNPIIINKTEDKKKKPLSY